jgi:hypothetical protein
MANRERLIERLINDDLQYDRLLGTTFIDPHYFEQVMRHGFKGYDNMTVHELIEECYQREISVGLDEEA